MLSGSSASSIPPICDAHVHFWTTNTHQWLETVRDPAHAFHRFSPLARTYVPNTYLSDMEGLEVKEAVYIQANMHAQGGFTPIEEVAWVSGIADGATGLLDVAIVGYADATDPEEFRRVTTACKQRYPLRYRGVRFMLDYHPERKELCQTDSPDHMKNPKVVETVRFLGSEGLTFDLQVCQCQLKEAALFAHACPDTQMLLNHAGFPLRGAFDEWSAMMSDLATAPNVAVKMGGFGAYDDCPFTAEETKIYVARCIELFGVDRCFFSSNLPVDLVDVSRPADRWEAFAAAVAHLPAEDQRKLFRDNARRYYSI